MVPYNIIEEGNHYIVIPLEKHLNYHLTRLRSC